MLRKIEVISIPVSNQDAALAFYREKLGMRVVNDSPMGENMRWLQLGIGEDMATIALVTWFPEMKPGCFQGLVLATDDIEASAKQLKAVGVDVGKIDVTPWGRFAGFRDPDGNGLMLHQP